MAKVSMLLLGSIFQVGNPMAFQQMSKHSEKVTGPNGLVPHLAQTNDVP